MPSQWFLVAAIPLIIAGCQNENRSDVPPSTSATPPAAQGGPAGARLDDTMKTNILLRQIHAANMDEIDRGKIALDKGQAAEVKKFASQMVTDHTMADQKLGELAKKMNFDINATPHDPVTQALQSASEDGTRALRGMSGAQFDVAYIAPQVGAHNQVLHVVQEAQKVATGDAKKFLDDTRPVVESHLDHAKALQRGLMFSPMAVGGGPGGMEAPAGSVMGTPSKMDAGHGEQKKPMPKTNP